MANQSACLLFIFVAVMTGSSECDVTIEPSMDVTPTLTVTVTKVSTSSRYRIRRQLASSSVIPVDSTLLVTEIQPTSTFFTMPISTSVPETTTRAPPQVTNATTVFLLSTNTTTLGLATINGTNVSTTAQTPSFIDRTRGAIQSAVTSIQKVVITGVGALLRPFAAVVRTNTTTITPVP